ncbi:MAG TPA: metallophosphoesterase [Thermomicrobiaceae bacterium]|nr:metallophosphoesterase [Thermomicrobiaceae bacterium]
MTTHEQISTAQPIDRDAAAPESSDGIDRRHFLKCMAWAGTGVLWTVSGGILSSCTFGGNAAAKQGDFTFAQISDSHIGFNKAPNTDVTATLHEAIAKVNALPARPAFVLHTGDLSHLSKPDEFDTVEQSLKSAKTDLVFYVPGEHDVFSDNGKQYFDRFGGGATGQGWSSFDYKGVHFVGLNNVMNLQTNGLGNLGPEQLGWLQKDVAGLAASTPIVVYAHIPLWTIYPAWGWGTQDSEQALSYLRRFGSVTVLNGHIHQVLQKVEGNITFHTARGTAFPQPAPGTAPAPGPMLVPANQLRKMLGIASVSYVEHKRPLAIVDSTLG